MYNKEQLAFIESPLSDSKLIAVPGSGKTTSIIGRLLYLIDKKILNKKNILVLTFSVAAKQHFLNLSKDSGVFNQNNVKTIHGAAKYILCQNKKSYSNCVETLIAAVMYYANKSINIGNLTGLKYLVVDEAQDISEIQYRFVLKLKEITGCYVTLVGDPNQSIFQFQGGSAKFLLNYDAKLFKLLKNYRSSSNIVNLVKSAAPYKTDIVTEKAASKDIFMFVDSSENILDHLTKKLKSIDRKYSIAVIGPVKRLRNSDIVTLQKVSNRLYKEKIPYSERYVACDDHNRNTKYVPNVVNLYTIHGSKGLEFDYVFVIGYNEAVMGRKLTIDRVEEFDSLWYVAFSRAKEQLVIYSYNKYFIYPKFKELDKDSFLVVGVPKISHEKIKPKEENNLGIPVTNLIRNLDPTVKFSINKGIKTYIVKQSIYDLPPPYEYEEFCDFYGIFAENLFRYHYMGAEKYLDMVKNKYNNLVFIPIHYKYDIDQVISEYILQSIERKNILITNKNKEQFAILERFIEDMESFCIVYESTLAYMDHRFITNMENMGVKELFKYTLFEYQIKTHRGYLWDKDFTKHIESMMPFSEEILKFAKKKKCLTFNVRNMHPNIKISGVADLIEDGMITEIKFTKELTRSHILQLFLYYNNIHPAWNHKKEFQLWNFLTGKIYNIKATLKFSNWQLIKMLATSLNMKLQNIVLAYDLETDSKISWEANIIERYFYEPNLDTVVSMGLVNWKYGDPELKGQNSIELETDISALKEMETDSSILEIQGIDISKPKKIGMDICIPEEITKLTGIKQEDLKNATRSGEVLKEIKEMIAILDNPTMITWNGSCFDNIILSRMGLEKYINLDIKHIAGAISGRDTLLDTYKKIVGGSSSAHRAEDDVKMLMAIVRKLNIKF